MDNGESSYRRFLDGDLDAFEEIIDAYGTGLIFFINGFVHNIDVAEEIMEDTFCDLIFYKNRYNNKAKFKTYLFAIAKHKACDYIKKEKKKGQVPIEDYMNRLTDLISVEDRIFENEEKKELYFAITQLNDVYRTFIYLRYFEDMSYDEIRHVLHKSPKQLKNISYRAKEALKAILEKGGVK